MGKGYGADKDTEKLIRLAKKQGWSIEVTGGNHLKWLPPTKSQDLVISGLTMNTSGILQTKKRLKKAGLNV